MNRWVIGVSVGVVAGVVDVIPMIFQRLPWEASASAFVFWVVGGILISLVQLPVPGIIKGVVVQGLALMPIAILVAAKEPASLVPMSIMTVILGGAAGFIIERFGKH